MSTLNTIRGHQLLIQIGDGGTPTEVFAHPAAINTTRGLTVSASTESDELIDTADQSAPAATVRAVKAIDTKIDGAGKIDIDSFDEYFDWSLSGLPKNVKVALVGTDIVYTGPYLLTSLQISGERMGVVEFQITLEQADKGVKS